MSKAIVDMSWFIRITRTYDEIHDLLDSIECDKIIAYEHSGDESVSRTHCHILLIGSKIKPDAIKTRYRKLYGDIERGDWSFKKCKEDYLPTVTYMSKGRLPPRLCKGFDPGAIIELTNKWVDPETVNVNVVDGKLVKDVKEKGKKSKRELLEIIRTKVEPGGMTRDVLKVIRKVLMDNNEVIGQYKMMDYYDSFMMYDRKEDWLSMMTAKINSKYNV